MHSQNNNSENINFLAEMANYTFTSKYARYNDKLKRRETWSEAVDRVYNMHYTKFKDIVSEEDWKEVEWAFSLVYGKRGVPSMRSMQFGGDAILAHNSRMFNCAVRHIDSIRSFAEVMYLLLSGCGVGIGLSKTFLNRLPNLVNAEDKNGTVITYVVQDNIEGWADSIEALLTCYFRNTAYSGRKIIFDYSRIRRKGSRLKVGGGKAPGYVPLKNCHTKIKKLLDHIIEKENQARMKSINAYDILMHCADAVLSGGVRRSATCVIFEQDDVEMLNAKIGNWNQENPQRGRSNNSVRLIRKNTTLEDFKNVIQRTKEWGEPGFVFANSEYEMFNPCFTGDTLVYTADGRNYTPIKQLAEEHWTGPIWTLKNGTFTKGYCSKVWKTREQADIICVTTNNGTFRCTPDHKIMLYTGEYVEAKNLQKCQLLKSSDKDYDPVFVDNIKILQEKEDVYDLTVDETHNFFISIGDFIKVPICVHNCFEISFIPVLEDGTCGVQFCNLTTSNGVKIKTKQDYLDCAKATTIIGTLQATYTDFKYLSPAAKQLTDEEALLGVSITGFMDTPDILLNSKYQEEAAKLCVEVNKKWAKILGINQAARITCVKPEGTSSIILECASGIHPHHAHKYFRRIQATKIDNVYEFFKSFNSHMTEESIWSAEKTDDVITFPITISETSIVKEDLTAIKHLEIVRNTQKHWVKIGTTEANKKSISHNVSCTIIVAEHEWAEVTEYIFKYKDDFAALSFLSKTGDKDFKQAPNEKIETKTDEKHFDQLQKNYTTVDYKYLIEEKDETHLQQELSCAGGNCEIL